jgi:serine/threonine-protein kinase
MEQDDLWLNDLADAILDGTPADLDSAASDASNSRGAALRQARILARIAELDRSLPADRDFDATARGEDTRSSLTSWGRLTIIEEIGRGAFGVVYRARDPRLDREVALKLLWPHAGIDPDRLAACVIEEGRLLARVRHANIVSIYDADQIDGRVGLTMEFVRGQTLEKALREQGPFTPAEVVGVGIQICHALSAVHQAGLLHRDIKAQNVMREEDGRLVLMDFGAGRALDRESGTDTGLAGTPLYLAPEIFDGQPATVQSDIYSVGVLLYHLLTGIYPVTGRTIRDVRQAHRQNQHVPLRAARLSAPDALRDVVDRALAPSAVDRYATAHAMAAALTDVDAPLPAAYPWRWLVAGVVLLDQVVARATVNASRVFPLFNDRGTLNVGAPADVAVLELREGVFEFVDNYGNKRTGRQRLFPSGTVLGGKRVPRV